MSTEITLTIMTGLITVQSLVLLMSARILYRTGKYLSELWRQMLTELWDLRGLIKKSRVTDLSAKAIKGQSTASGNVDEKASGKAGSI